MGKGACWSSLQKEKGVKDWALLTQTDRICSLKVREYLILALKLWMFLKANEAQWGSCEWNSSRRQLTAQTAFKTKTLGIQRALKQLWTVLSCWVIHWSLLWSRTRTNPPWLEQGCEIFNTLSSLCRYSCVLPQRLGYAVCPPTDHWGQWQIQTSNSRGTGSTEITSLPSPPSVFLC